MTAHTHSSRQTEPDRLELRRQCLLALCLAMVAFGSFEFLLAMLSGYSILTGLMLGLAVACLTGLIVARLLRQSRGIPVLTYHSVSNHADWLPWSKDISIRPETLDRQLQLFRRMGLQIVDSQAMTEARLTGTELPKNTIALHFDDGYLDTRVAAWPILKRHGACATVFVSTDFVAPDQPVRPTTDQSAPLRWDGYMSWRELRELDADGTFRVEAHGTDHGRIVTGSRIVTRLNSENVGKLSWMQWAQMPGDKHDWYLRSGLPVPLGSPVRESAPSLSARKWFPGDKWESDASFDDRVRKTFATCQSVFEREIGRKSSLFCWPQNKSCCRARSLAAQAGFIATTGGTGRNEAGSDPAVISRVHIGQDYAGFRCGWIDDLAVRAQIRCFQGDVGWALTLAAIGTVRRLVLLTRQLPVSAPQRFALGQQERMQ